MVWYPDPPTPRSRCRAAIGGCCSCHQWPASSACHYTENKAVRRRGRSLEEWKCWEKLEKKMLVRNTTGTLNRGRQENGRQKDASKGHAWTMQNAREKERERERCRKTLEYSMERKIPGPPHTAISAHRAAGIVAFDTGYAQDRSLSAIVTHRVQQGKLILSRQTDGRDKRQRQLHNQRIRLQQHVKTS